VLASAGGADCVLCQITSKPYGDRGAVVLAQGAFAEGGLPRESFVRPGKLFTASESIFVRPVGRLTPAAHATVVDGVVTLLRAGLK
jgi:mRNA interferase MazF